jgi:hypothetical protein
MNYDAHGDRDRSSLLNSMSLHELENERVRVHNELCDIFPEGEDLSLQNALTIHDDDALSQSLLQNQNTLWGNLIKEAVRISYFGQYYVTSNCTLSDLL